MGRLALISLGGALGTAARYLLSVGLLRALGPAFPYGTLAVNVIGSFLLGVIMQAGGDTSPLSPTTRLVLGTGVMGGFTTYSAFNYETLRYVQDNTTNHLDSRSLDLLAGRRITKHLAVGASAGVTQRKRPRTTKRRAMKRSADHDEAS